MTEERFPIYLMSRNEKSIYRITDPRSLVEIQIIGKSYIKHEIEATILPEFNLIMDIIQNNGNRWLEISEEEYDEKFNYCIENLTEIKA